MEWRNYSWYPSSCPRATVQNAESNPGLPQTGKASTNPTKWVQQRGTKMVLSTCGEERVSEPALLSSQDWPRRLFTVVPHGSRHQMKQETFRLAWRRSCFPLRKQLCRVRRAKHENRLPKEAGQSPSLKAFNTGVEELRSPHHWPCFVQRIAQRTWGLTQSRLPTIIRLGAIPISITKGKQNPK